MKLKTKDLIIISLMGISLLAYLNEFFIPKEKNYFKYSKKSSWSKTKNVYFSNRKHNSHGNCG